VNHPARPARDEPLAGEAAELRYAKNMLGLLSITLVISALSGGLLNVSLPVVVRHFDASAVESSWLLLGAMLTTTSLIIMFGRLADMYGRVPIFMGGLVVMTTTSILAGLAPTVQVLIVVRMVQAVGTAMLLAVMAAMLTVSTPAAHLSRFMGVYMSALASASLAGPILGAILADTVGWRWLFWFQAPFGLVCLIWALRTLRPMPTVGSSGEIKTAGDDFDASDFELSPSSVIDALEQPDSGSDFELTALDPSDEFESTPLAGPSDSDVTAAEPGASGINLGRPSDSGTDKQREKKRVKNNVRQDIKSGERKHKEEKGSKLPVPHCHYQHCSEQPRDLPSKHFLQFLSVLHGLHIRGHGQLRHHKPTRPARWIYDPRRIDCSTPQQRSLPQSALITVFRDQESRQPIITIRTRGTLSQHHTNLTAGKHILQSLLRPWFQLRRIHLLHTFRGEQFPIICENAVKNSHIRLHGSIDATPAIARGISFIV